MRALSIDTVLVLVVDIVIVCLSPWIMIAMFSVEDIRFKPGWIWETKAQMYFTAMWLVFALLNFLSAGTSDNESEWVQRLFSFVAWLALVAVPLIWGEAFVG